MPASTTTAPELTREQVQAILVQPLTAASVFLAAGPRIFRRHRRRSRPHPHAGRGDRAVLARRERAHQRGRGRLRGGRASRRHQEPEEPHAVLERVGPVEHRRAGRGAAGPDGLGRRGAATATWRGARAARTDAAGSAAPRDSRRVKPHSCTLAQASARRTIPCVCGSG